MFEIETISRYRPIARLGADEYSVFWLGASDGSSGCPREVVLSTLQPHVARLDGVRRAFLEALRAAPRPGDPRLVLPEMVSIDRESVFRLTAATPGWNLASLLGPDLIGRAPLTVSGCMWIAHQVAVAVASTKNRADSPFVHGGIEPKAVHLSIDGSVRLTTPMLLDGRGWSLTTPTEFRPTPDSGPSDERADVFAVARTLRHALERLADRSRGSVEDYVPSSGALGQLLDGALADDPSRRPTDLGALARELSSVAPIHVGAGHVARLVGSLPAEAMTYAGAPRELDDATTVASARSGPEERASAPVVAVSPQPPTLRLDDGASPRELRLPDGVDRWIVGRGRGAALVLDDPDVSREHFEILRCPDGEFRVFDLGSKNGLLVNGRVTDEHVLSSGDELRAGSTRMRFEA